MAILYTYLEPNLKYAYNLFDKKYHSETFNKTVFEYGTRYSDGVINLVRIPGQSNICPINNQLHHDGDMRLVYRGNDIYMYCLHKNNECASSSKLLGRKLLLQATERDLQQVKNCR